MSNTQKITVTLNSPSDWYEWIEVIKTQALTGKVWDYIDPSKKDDEVSTLEEPKQPEPKNITSQKSTFAELTQEERDEYRIRRQDYKWKRDEFDKKDSALSSLRTTIQNSTSRSNLHYTLET